MDDEDNGDESEDSSNASDIKEKTQEITKSDITVKPIVSATVVQN